jgi:hypothetical protein
MLIDEARDIVNLIVNDHIQILLGVVLRDLLESEFLRHLDDCIVCTATNRLV